MHTQQEHEFCIPLKAQLNGSTTPLPLKLFSSCSLDYSLADYTSHDQRITTGTCVLYASPWKHEKKIGPRTPCTINRINWSGKLAKQTICYNHRWHENAHVNMIRHCSRGCVDKKIIMSVCEIIRLSKVIHEDRMCVGYLSAHILPRRSSGCRIGRSGSLVQI